MKRRLIIYPVILAAALVAASGAWAHAEVSPAVTAAKHAQVFTLAVPTEKENSETTQIELTVPEGFGIDSFVPSPGWKRTVQSTGSGEDTVINKVTWSGGKVPTEEDAAFSFLASTTGTGSYTFGVRQTYSDGSVVNWSGAESSDTPAPVVKAVSSFGGGGSSTLGIVAVAVGAVALLLAVGGLLARGGRPLT